MGIWASPERLLMGTLYQLWRFDNALPPGQAHKGHDRLYVPQLAWTTGDLDVHDIAVDRSGRPVFVNTLFSCLATVSELQLQADLATALRQQAGGRGSLPSERSRHGRR